MRPELFTMSPIGTGRVSTMARPRGGDWLEDEMKGLREAGVEVLVSMLILSEETEFALTGERAAADQVGIEFVALPTPDRGTPSVAEFNALLSRLDVALQEGRHVAVHCRAGIGRSSLVAAGLLIKNGASAEDAWRVVATARGLDVPDTPEQRAWLSAATTLA